MAETGFGPREAGCRAIHDSYVSLMTVSSFPAGITAPLALPDSGNWSVRGGGSLKSRAVAPMVAPD